MRSTGLDLLGIPNFADDLTIEIPAGTFFVAEACAGLRFLIAAVAFGVFYALLNYRSPLRRAVFIGASIIVPVIANGFRALGIVVLGNILGNAEAAAADHIIYGWVFFSVVMLLLVAAGLPMREPQLVYAAPASRPKVLHAGAAPIWAAVAACLLVAAGPAVAASLSAFATQAPLTALPSIALPAGCQQTGALPTLPATRAALTVECGEQRFEIAIQTFPARSTSADLLAERRRVTGELGAEDASYSGLGVAGQDQGDWTLVQTIQPYRTTALASWVDGKPAQPGIRGRIAQANAAVLGSQYAPVLMTISTDEPRRLNAERRAALVKLMRELAAAQRGLTEQIAALSKR